MGTRPAIAICIVIATAGAAALWFGGHLVDESNPPATSPRVGAVVTRPAADPVVAVAAPRIAPTGAQPTTPDYGPRNDGSPPIYRCGSRGSTVYSNTPCDGARVVDGASAVSGYDSRPSERMERLVAQGRDVEAPTVVLPASRLRPRDADEGRDCETMRRQIADIDAEARQPHSGRWLDELRATRQDIRTRMAREHC